MTMIIMYRQWCSALVCVGLPPHAVLTDLKAKYVSNRNFSDDNAFGLRLASYAASQ